MIVSSKTKKQRKKFYFAKLHQRQKFFGANLSKELRKVLKKRSLSVRKGDKAKVVRGKHSGKTGKVAGVNYAKIQVFIEGIMRKKADGKEVFIPIHPSKLQLVELVTEDKKREVLQAAKIKKEEEKKEEKQEKKESTTQSSAKTSLVKVSEHKGHSHEKEHTEKKHKAEKK